jgi:hypothetical protein
MVMPKAQSRFPASCRHLNQIILMFRVCWRLRTGERMIRGISKVLPQMQSAMADQ